MNKKQLLVFDIDGTLTDSVKVHQNSFTQALHRLGVQHFDNNYGAYKHHTDSYIAKIIYEKELNTKFKESTLHTFEKYLTEHILKFRITEIAGAKKLIQNLTSKSEVAICFATGSLRKPAAYKLEAIGIKYAPQLLVASNTIYERENIVSSAIEQAAEYYKTDKFERIIAVGDGLWDLIAAEKLSIEFIGIGATNKDTLLKNGMKQHFDTLEGFKI